MQEDPLQRDLSKVQTAWLLPYEVEPPKGTYIDMRKFLCAMTKASWLDVFSYSFGQLPAGLQLRRVIFCVSPTKTRPPDIPEKVEVRGLYAVHTKLWIGKFGKTVRAYVGSFNLGLPTIQNVMVEHKETKYWLSYFEHFWKQGRNLPEI